MKKHVVPEMLMDAVEGWTKVSDYLHVHSSGARIERLGCPATPGWYLIDGESNRRFEPTIQGCDQAFISFAGQRAALAFLSRILGAGAKRKRAG
jgi:hypothetical protein